MLARLFIGGGCHSYKNKSLCRPKTLSVFFKVMSSNEPPVKKIGTHDGTFHCDEALACYMLRLVPEYEEAKIVRTRDEKILAGCDVVVDVGGVYDHSRCRYDHHQSTFDETLATVRKDLKKRFTIKLSSAGLIYAHYGEEIIKSLTNLKGEAVKAIYEKVYEYLIQEVDAIDNGVPICEGAPKYVISTNLSSRIGRLNPAWNAPDKRSQDEIFQDAVEETGVEFLDKVNYYAQSWWPAREVVIKSVEGRFDVHPGGRVVELAQFVPWKQHFFDIEKELSANEEIRFFIFQDKGGWRVIAVPIEPDSFICRTFLKKEWWGKRDEELSKLSGIEGCVFCHQTGFIGGNSTREGALKMALESL